MKKPLVTIITPAYNCGMLLGDTLKSVLDNGYENIEYIVIDDGSTDFITEHVIDMYQWAGYDHTVKLDEMIVIRHSNIGEQQTVNKGLQLVKGKYFMIVNADDPLLLGAVECLLNIMEAHPDVLCAYPDWKSINEDGSTRAHIKSRDYDFIYMVRHHTCLPSVGSMFRSDIIKTVGYRDTSFHWLGDFDFWLRVGLAGKMVHVPATLATWRCRVGQASGNKSDKRAQEHIRVMQKFYSMPDIPDSILKVKREAICWSYIVAAVVSKSKRHVIAYLFKGWVSYPQILLSFEFWDALVRRAYYILRR